MRARVRKRKIVVVYDAGGANQMPRDVAGPPLPALPACATYVTASASASSMNTPSDDMASAASCGVSAHEEEEEEGAALPAVPVLMKAA